MRKPTKNEILIRDRDNWLFFTVPHQIIVVEHLDDVVPALQEIERQVEMDDWHAAGFISYDAAAAFDAALPQPPTDGFPYMWFGLYPKPRSIKLPKPAYPKEVLNWQPSIDRSGYDSAISRIKEYIANGRTYQVNYTMHVQTDFDIDTWQFFLHLAQSQNRHAAYMDTGRYVICSASPELFFQLDENTITCRPMKGTVKRGRTTIEDHQQAEWLKNSGKNRAENVMIVDMIRNDLGRVAKTGSVSVPHLFTIERYPTLWQMTSTVTAQTHASFPEIIQALFPCASITGAPRISTMKIIKELETAPRRVYTGSIGYLAPGRKAKFNVAIRTALIDRQTHKAEYGVGGGIVWDSTSADEYAEALLKARVLTDLQPTFSLFETMLWTPEEGYFLREKHIARLLDSADYFDFPISRAVIEMFFNNIANEFAAPQRVRVLLHQDGSLKSECTAYHAIEKTIRAVLAEKPLSSQNIFLFHKTTERTIYEKARENRPEFDDVLLFNEHGQLTEFTIGNLVVELNGQLLTPPIACGVLPGTFRAHVVESGQVLERVISVQQLKDCAKIFRINSIRKWETVEMSAFQ